MPKITDIPFLPEFVYDDNGEQLPPEPTPAAPVEATDLVVDDVTCPAGWVVEVAQALDEPPATGPATIAITVFTAQHLLADAIREVTGYHQQLAGAGLFGATPEQFNLNFSPAGPAFDSAGNPFTVDQTDRQEPAEGPDLNPAGPLD